MNKNNNNGLIWKKIWKILFHGTIAYNTIQGLIRIILLTKINCLPRPESFAFYTFEYFIYNSSKETITHSFDTVLLAMMLIQFVYSTFSQGVTLPQFKVIIQPFYCSWTAAECSLLSFCFLLTLWRLGLLLSTFELSALFEK